MLFSRESYALACFVSYLSGVTPYCNENVRSYNFEMDNVYGMWFGVGYAQHSPDLTNKPNDIGCVTIYISDVTNDPRDDWVGLDNTFYRRNWTQPKWRSPYNNPWSETPLSGSWMDYSVQRLVKRDVSYYGDRRLRVVWDEDGQTEEQSYVYSSFNPGLWKLEQWRPGEREMLSRGLDVWYPDDPPRRPEIIHVLKSSPYLMVVYHCSEDGGGRTFSLVLKRSPSKMTNLDWYDMRKIFFSYELPNVHRYTAVCSGCTEIASILFVFVCVLFLYFFK